MQIDLIVVGHIKNKDIKNVVSEYEKRVSKYCKLAIKELKDAPNNFDESKVLEMERDNILKVLDTNSYLFILDVQSKMLSSEEFSKKINEITTYESGKITFLIGGSMGIHEDIKKMAKFKMSFSKMTFPHQLFRAIFLEQLYRQFKISNNEPYHK